MKTDYCTQVEGPVNTYGLIGLWSSPVLKLCSSGTDANRGRDASLTVIFTANSPVFPKPKTKRENSLRRESGGGGGRCGQGEDLIGKDRVWS